MVIKEVSFLFSLFLICRRSFNFTIVTVRLNVSEINMEVHPQELLATFEIFAEFDSF